MNDEQLYEALIDMGYYFGEYDADEFDEVGFSEAALNLGYRWDESNMEWSHRDIL